MVIMAPILEEITYRYFLFGGIAKYNRKWAIVISGFIFMAVHAVASFTQDVDNIFREIILLPPYMFSGMALAYAYDKSENLATSTIIHSLNNLISFILCLL
jgi:membrane protease YdiL (CAAX protease family)